MRVTFLASGSSGNAAVIESGGRAVLLDAGLSAREILRRAEIAGAGDARIEAILLTHEHVDHVRGARVLSRRLGVPVFGTAGTLTAAATHLDDVPETVRVERRERFTLAGLRITTFATAHDAAEPVGYAFESRSGRRLVIATDTGTITPEIADAFAGAHVVGIESNHDVRMLEAGPYPPFLKRRIAGERGHLSNDDAASAVSNALWRGLGHVFALHISEQNNTPEHARSALARALGRTGSANLEMVGRNEILGCEV